MHNLPMPPSFGPSVLDTHLGLDHIQYVRDVLVAVAAGAIICLFVCYLALNLMTVESGF